jgi:hypothetical protein
MTRNTARAQCARTPDPCNKAHQRGTVDLGAPRRGGIMPSDTILDMGDPFQRRVPAGLKLARDQTLGRIDEFVAAAGQGGLITRFLKLAAQRLPDVVLGLHRLLGGLDGGICCIGGKGRAARRLRPAQAVRPKICCTKDRCAGMSPRGTARTCPLASITIASMPANVRFAVQKP